MNEPGRQPVRIGLDTPWVAAALAAVLVALVGAVLLVPGLVGPSPGPSASATGGPPSSTPTCGPVDSGASGEPTACPTGSAPPSPTGSPAPSASEPAASESPTAVPSATFVSYVVQPGDSLTSIARTFGTNPRSIAWWNRVAYPTLDPESDAYDPNHIEPGWILAVLPGGRVDESNPPTWPPGYPTPGPSASPTPSGTLGPTPTAGPPGGPAAVISHGTRGTNQVALTFDMGGRLDPAVDIVQWLTDHGIRATIFPTGSTGTTTTLGRAALQLADARPDLFDIGNHSWDHPNFTELTAEQMADQLTRTETAVMDLIGQSTKPWFRPPNGAWTYAVRVGVGAAGWSQIIMWDIDTLDWKLESDGGPTADDIVTKVVSQAQGGSIVLMHLGGYHTLEALPGILSGLQARGLQPVTLAEMLPQ
jgi:peptidoglycan/xylan/chitin deacetylase (PgdA/CDA1 family)/LysM repeat protein